MATKTYKDGTSEPKIGDTVLGDKLKGQVVAVKDKVTVKVRGAYNPSTGAETKPVFYDRDAVELDLVKRK